MVIITLHLVVASVLCFCYSYLLEHMLTYFWQQNFAIEGVAYLCNFVSGRSGPLPETVLVGINSYIIPSLLLNFKCRIISY